MSATRKPFVFALVAVVLSLTGTSALSSAPAPTKGVAIGSCCGKA